MINQGKSCQICDGYDFSKRSYLDTYGHILFKNKSMLVCQECGFGKIYPKVDKEKINDFYENYWRSEKSPAFIDFREWSLSKNVIDPRSISQLLLGSQYLKNKQQYSFMDIGPGIGWSFISVEKILGNVEIRNVFKLTKAGIVAGCYVLDGSVLRNSNVRLIRDGIVVYTGLLDSLKRFKEDVKDVQKGYECGLTIQNFNDIKVGDVVEVFEETSKE